jgi:hypothetical protein
VQAVCQRLMDQHEEAKRKAICEFEEIREMRGQQNKEALEEARRQLHDAVLSVKVRHQDLPSLHSSLLTLMLTLSEYTELQPDIE